MHPITTEDIIVGTIRLGLDDCSPQKKVICHTHIIFARRMRGFLI